jgi:cytochrome c-type biogenesis protein CcmH/NrfF
VAVQTCEGQSLSSAISELLSAIASTYCKNQSLEQENHNLKVTMQNVVSQLEEKTRTQYQVVDILQSTTATAANDSGKEKNLQTTKVDSLGRR